MFHFAQSKYLLRPRQLLLGASPGLRERSTTALAILIHLNLKIQRDGNRNDNRRGEPAGVSHLYIRCAVVSASGITVSASQGPIAGTK